jgi:hypothetical protein
MVELKARHYPENLRGGCTNHPSQSDVLRATAVENMCDGHRKYVRRPSHETSKADTEMGQADMEMGWADTETGKAVLQHVDNEYVPVMLKFCDAEVVA